MKTTNIFCIISKTGGGKTEYMNRVFMDRGFLFRANLDMLVYGTTRNKRHGEKEGVDYYYHSIQEFKSIPDEDIVESRSYFTLNDGTIYYFTKNEYFEKSKGNILCITSPYQFESYRSWCDKQNVINPGRYNLYAIIIDTKVDIRIERVLKRANGDEAAIYELCRRIIEERAEFEDVFERIPELKEPMIYDNICYIDNNSSEIDDINRNSDLIRSFILRYCD